MPRNPAPAKQKKTEPKTRKEPVVKQDDIVTPVEPGEERGVPKVAEPAPPVEEEPTKAKPRNVRPYQCPVCRLVPNVRPCNYCADNAREAAEAASEDPPPHAPPVQVIERRIETVTVGIPLGEPPHRINALHLNVRLTRDHAHIFARLRQALADKHAKTADGHNVTYAADALRWLLERIESC